MALLKPNQLSPQNSVIDATAENRFSWQTNGDRQTGYRLYIYNNDTDAELYDSTEITSPNNYHDLSADTLSNGVACKWYVNTIAGSSNQDSEYEYFETNATPIVTFDQPDFTIEERWILQDYQDLTDIETRRCDISADTVIYLENYDDTSMRMTATGSDCNTVFRPDNIDLNYFPNGTASTTADVIYTIVYIHDIAEMNTTGINVQVNSGGGYYVANYPKSGLITGWNYLSTAKADFTTFGVPDNWADVDYVEVEAIATSSLIMNIQTFEMRKIGSIDSTTIELQDYTMKLNYSQDQDVSLKAYKFILSDSDGAEITDTGWLYDFALEYEFTGFENNTTYTIEGKALSQNNQEGTTGEKTFDVSYTSDVVLPAIQATENDDGYIRVNWSNIQYRNATYTPSTPVYVTGQFGSYGIEVQGGDSLDMGSITITGESEYTLTSWIQLFTGQDGDFINIDDTYYIGYDIGTERFYYYDSSNYLYSDVVSLSSLIGGYIFIGLTNDYFIVKKDRVLQTSITLTSATVPTVIDSLKYLGRIYVDNSHGQATKLDYDTLIDEDSTFFLSATPILDTNIDSYYPLTSLKISSTRNLTYANQTYSGSTGYLSITDNSGTVYSSTPVDASGGTYASDSMMDELDTNLFAIAYRDQADSGKGKIKLFSTASDTINILDTETFWDFSIDNISISKMADGYILAIYEASGALLAQIIGYTSTTISSNQVNYITVLSASVGTPQCLGIDATTAIVYFVAGSGGITNLLLTRNGTQLTEGTNFTITEYPSASYVRKLIKIDSTHVVYTFRNSTQQYIGITEVSGSNLVNDYFKLVYTKTSAAKLENRLVHIYDSYYGLVMEDDNYSGVQLFKIDENYNVINQENLQFLGVDYVTVSANPCGTNELCIYFYNSGNYQFIYSNFNLSTISENKEAVWVSNSSRFLGNFEQSLSIGNWTTEINGFRLKRLASDGSLFQTLADFTSSDIYYDDMTPRNGIAYTYALYSLNDSGNEDLGTSVTETLDTYGWFLTDGTSIYKFDMGNSSSDIGSTQDITVFENYTQYPTLGYGQRNYRSGSMNTIPYTYNSTSLEFSFTLSLLNELRAFINSSTTKYLKNTKGEIFKVITSEFSYKYYDDVPDQIYEISFDWIEVGIGEELD